MKRQRNEYPRPQFRREEWLPLNGEWEFAFDDDNEGIKKGYYKGERALDKKIQAISTRRAESKKKKTMKLYGIAAFLKYPRAANALCCALTAVIISRTHG